MVGPSKILTVSYGTFSCTLEGFDNPFSTMRGIAEYFRDLAADDRYFGAEPPIPDAEMLHRIAESGASKPVVAHVEDNGVTLRQVEDTSTEEQTDEVTAPAAFEPEKKVANDPFVDEPADTVALNEPSQVEAESVASKLARIRAVVSEDNEATDDYDLENQVFANAPISAAFDDTLEPPLEAEPTEALDAEIDSTFEDPANDEPQNVQDQEAEPETLGEPEDQFGQDNAEAYVSSLEQQDQPSDFDEVTVTDVTDVATEAVDTTPSVPEAETTSEAEGQSIDEASIAEFMAVAESAGTESEVEEIEESDDPDSSAISRVVKMRRSDFDAAQADDVEDSATDLDIEVEPEAIETDTAGTDAEEEGGSTLSAEDEAELMANLQEVQRKADAEERAEKEGRALLENNDIESSGESVSRILDVTNTELEESEGTRRRSAIAHLKAAVAATRADKFMAKKRQEEEADELNQYRNDLAKVVKPRRPSDSGKAARQAPLMLVSEQRVDEPEHDETPESQAIQPRRISNDDLEAASNTPTGYQVADAENLFVENNTFAEFAEEMGASELPDLLEAAAAYSAYIEGKPHFSRPQIMQAVSAIQEEEFTREEGLRSFGLLLRRGKIKKLKRGQFTVADTTRFHPHPRAVGA